MDRPTSPQPLCCGPAYPTQPYVTFAPACHRCHLPPPIAHQLSPPHRLTPPPATGFLPDAARRSSPLIYHQSAIPPSSSLRSTVLPIEVGYLSAIAARPPPHQHCCRQPSTDWPSPMLTASADRATKLRAGFLPLLCFRSDPLSIPPWPTAASPPAACHRCCPPVIHCPHTRDAPSSTVMPSSHLPSSVGTAAHHRAPSSFPPSRQHSQSTMGTAPSSSPSSPSFPAHLLRRTMPSPAFGQAVPSATIHHAATQIPSPLHHLHHTTQSPMATTFPPHMPFSIFFPIPRFHGHPSYHGHQSSAPPLLLF